jgi:hypothetical protein
MGVLANRSEYGFIVSLNTGLTDIYCLKKFFRFFSDRGTRTEPLKVVEASSVANPGCFSRIPNPEFSPSRIQQLMEGYNKLRYLCYRTVPFL